MIESEEVQIKNFVELTDDIEARDDVFRELIGYYHTLHPSEMVVRIKEDGHWKFALVSKGKDGSTECYPLNFQNMRVICKKLGWTCVYRPDVSGISLEVIPDEYLQDLLDRGVDYIPEYINEENKKENKAIMAMIGFIILIVAYISGRSVVFSTHNKMNTVKSSVKVNMSNE